MTDPHSERIYVAKAERGSQPSGQGRKASAAVLLKGSKMECQCVSGRREDEGGRERTCRMNPPQELREKWKQQGLAQRYEWVTARCNT